MFGSDEIIRVGMIGCGSNARGHMRRLLDIEGVEIVAICDPDDAAVTAAGEVSADIAKARVFGDYREMLADVEMDAVEISTPHTLHYEQIIASLAAGLHVLCDKPMVCRSADARAVLDKVEETGLTLGVSYQRHGLAPYRYCREAITSGAAGNCHFVSCVQSQNWYRKQVGDGTWRSQMKWSGGGQLNDSGSHLLDIVLWMTELSPVEVFAFQDNMGSEVDILSAISVKFENNALCNLAVVGHAVNFYEEIVLYCENATMVIAGDEVWRWEDEVKEVISSDQLGSSPSPDANFIGALRGEEEIQASPDCALEVARLSEAVWESAASGRPVATT